MFLVSFVQPSITHTAARHLYNQFCGRLVIVCLGLPYFVAIASSPLLMDVTDTNIHELIDH